MIQNEWNKSLIEENKKNTNNIYVYPHTNDGYNKQ